MSHPFWSLHTHSRFSVKDALPAVEQMVTEAVALGYPALGLTDHGSVSGTVSLYKECRKEGIEPLPGIELYTTPDAEYGIRKYQHLTVVAYSETGYRNLSALATLSAQKYHYKPRVDWADFAQMAEDGRTRGLAVSTGCYFGAVIQSLLNVGERQARQMIAALASWFPRVYVELQNHGIVHDENGEVTDDLIVEALVGIADSLGLPFIVTQDSHYVRREDKPLHEAFKRLVSFSDDPDDAVFPGDSFHMVDRNWLGRYFEPKVLDAACTNLADLAESAHVRIPELDTFQLKVPDVTISGEPMKELRELSLERCAEVYPGKSDYLDRLEQELTVIETSGMAGYLLLVAKVCEFMQASDIWYSARGSASGSLVCQLLQITQVDPVAWGLRFDRFLSTDRTRPPDIDLDVEHTQRHRVGDWLAERFAITQVGTIRKYSMTTEEGEDDDGKGSLLQAHYTAERKRTGRSLTWQEIPAADRHLLYELSRIKPYAGYGTHAAGYVVAPDEQALSTLPQAYIASSKTFISAYGKKDVERCGFVKLDILGLRDLTAFKVACHLSGVNEADIPLNDRAVYKRISRGMTDGVFQLQGPAMSKGCERLRPRNIEDIAAAQALFRPATMHSGATTDYMSRRNRTEPVPQMHPDITEETKSTFGVLLYQEQVIGVLRRLRMPADELTEMLDAVKASNDYVAGARVALEQAKPRIRQLAQTRGWAESDIEWLINAIAAFADYSFNKAHAVSYGVKAYRSAWMAEHHPEAFWAGVLTAFLNHDKEPLVRRSARRSGVRLLHPHVNKSKEVPVIETERKGIRLSLLSIKGVGPTAAAEIAAKAPFSSLQDLGERCLAKRVTGAKHLAIGKPVDECGGTVAALFEAGALDGLE